MSEERVDVKRDVAESEASQAAQALYQAPTQAVALPSRGKIYPEGSPLHGTDTIEIKAMTAKEEDIISSTALLKQGKAFSMLLRSCVADKRVDPDKMLSGDRNAMLIAIRVSGYGADYVSDVTCPVCDDQSEHTFSLSDLPVRELSADPIRPGENEFEFTLPVSGKSVTFKLLTGEDEIEMSRMAERRKKALNNALEQNVTQTIFHRLVSVDGERDRDKVARFVANMPARDSLELREYMEDVAPGVETSAQFTCPSCGAEEEVAVPMGPSFFWPQLRKRSKRQRGAAGGALLGG